LGEDRRQSVRPEGAHRRDKDGKGCPRDLLH